MINTGIFDYIDVLGKTADASWLRNEIITNNLANSDTPNYKRQEVAFDEILATEIKLKKTNSAADLDKLVSNVDLNRLEGRVYTDAVGYSYRIDGNNVDVDTENVELASEQIKYNGLISSINSEFSMLKSVIK